MKPRHALIHPLAFSAFSIVSVMATNIEKSSLVGGVRALAAAPALGFATLLVFYFITRRIEQAAAMTSISVLFFFAYGHVMNGAYTSLSDGSLFPLMTGAIWTGLWGLAMLALVRTRRSIPLLTAVLNAAALGALALPIWGIAAHEFELRQPPVELSPQFETIQPLSALPREDAPPDIYYVILDGYGRQDILQGVLGFDNSSFISTLKDDGFYVADRSRSNYAQTALSLASSLNMEYLDALPASMGAQATDQLTLSQLIHSNKVMQILKEIGYHTVAFSTGYRRTEIETADFYFRAPLSSPTPTESLILELSSARIGWDLSRALGLKPGHPGYEYQRQQIEYVLDGLTKLSNVPRPRFVFAHIVAPHPPYVFGPDGSPRNPSVAFQTFDGSDFPGSTQEYVDGYVGQLRYINARMSAVLEEILAESDATPIVILQGDHGPGSRLDWESAANTDLAERFGILNAYLLPGNGDRLLSRDISPVNSFRVILNNYFGFRVPYLPNESYFSNWDAPYNFAKIGG